MRTHYFLTTLASLILCALPALAQAPRAGYSVDPLRGIDNTQRRQDLQRSREVFEDPALLEEEALAKIEVGEGEVIIYDDVRGARVLSVNKMEVEEEGTMEEGWLRRRCPHSGKKLTLQMERTTPLEGTTVEKVACRGADPGSTVWVWRGFYGLWVCQPPKV